MMRSILSPLAAILFLSFASQAMAAERDCTKSSRPDVCEAKKKALEVCKDKKAEEMGACYKAEMQKSGVLK
jgi:hypothetical protein